MYNADLFDRAPRGAAPETLQRFGVPPDTLLSSYLRSVQGVIVSIVGKGVHLALSSKM